MSATGTAEISVKVDSDERFVRRFDDSDPSHADTITVDEGTGQRRLRGGALRFHDDGCSVYRVRTLDALSLPVTCIVTQRHSAIACTTRAAVETFRPGPDAPEFLLRSDPLEPGEIYDPAHSLICETAEFVSKTKRRTAIADLARTAFTIR